MCAGHHSHCKVHDREKEEVRMDSRYRPGNNCLVVNSLGQCFNLACYEKILGQCVNNLGQYRPDNSKRYCPTLVKYYLIPILFSDNLPTYKFYDIFPISYRYKKQISTKMEIC